MKIAIFDGNPLVWRASVIYAQLSLRSGRPSGCLYGALKNLMKAWGEVRCDHMVVVWDWGHSRWRKALYPGYKASRTAVKKEDKSPHSHSEVMSQLWACQQGLEYAGIQQVVVENVEADDLIGVLSSGLAALGHDVWIVGSDRDLHQLLRPGVAIYDPLKKVSISVADIPALYDGLGVHQLVDYATISGEAGDDIPKLPGIGPKRAVELLKAFSTLDEILRMEPDPGWQKTAWGRALADGRETLRLSRRLVRIPTVDFLDELTVEERGRILVSCEREPVGDRLAFSSFCDMWELRQIQQDVVDIFSLRPISLGGMRSWLC